MAARSPTGEDEGLPGGEWGRKGRGGGGEVEVRPFPMRRIRFGLQTPACPWLGRSVGGILLFRRDLLHVAPL